LPFALNATELKPWFGNPFELEGRATYVFQNFQEMQTGEGLVSYVSNDNFLTLSLSTSIWGNWDAEFELTGAQTRAHCFNYDCARLTGRYLWMDDVIGDPFSITSGITLTLPQRISIIDPGSFHHGYFEAEFHTALGRESVCGPRWKSRWWLIGGVGIATQGSPWLRADGVIEVQHFIGHALELGAYTLWGLGGDNIVDLDAFRGYGPIAHRSVDVGFAYLYRFDCWGTLKLGYRRRVYAHNFPDNANYLIVEYLYPFGL
jgi:hypothetical protein